MAFRNALVLINPMSGRRRGEALGTQVSELLVAEKIETEVHRLGEDVSIDRLVSDAVARGCDLVVVAGGDGTLRSCLDALQGTGIPVLLVPAGTSNLIATHLRLPTRPRGLIKLLESGQVRKLDVCWLDSEPFVLAAGFGLATDVISDADHELKRYLGPVAYLWSLLRNLPRRRVRVEIRFEDGRVVRHRSKLVLFANCAETVAQVDIAPNSAVDDGFVDVAVFRFANLWQFLRLVGFAVTARWRRAREAVFYRTRRAEVWLRPPLPVQIDGDIFEARSYFQVRVQPEALHVLAPKPRPPLIPREWLVEAERRLELLRTGSRQSPAEIVRAIWDEYITKTRRQSGSVTAGEGAEETGNGPEETGNGPEER